MNEDDICLLESAAENLRGGGHDPKSRSEAAFRIASKLDEMRKRLSNWQPPVIDERPDGFRCLAFHRGRWRDVIWSTSMNGWMFGYGSPCIYDGNRLFAPLPKLPDDAPDFWNGDQS